MQRPSASSAEPTWYSAGRKVQLKLDHRHGPGTGGGQARGTCAPGMHVHVPGQQRPYACARSRYCVSTNAELCSRPRGSSRSMRTSMAKGAPGTSLAGTCGGSDSASTYAWKKLSTGTNSSPFAARPQRETCWGRPQCRPAPSDCQAPCQKPPLARRPRSCAATGARSAHLSRERRWRGRHPGHHFPRAGSSAVCSG